MSFQLGLLAVVCEVRLGSLQSCWFERARSVPDPGTVVECSR